MKTKLITEITPNSKLKLPKNDKYVLTVDDLFDLLLLVVLSFGIIYFGWGILNNDFNLADLFKDVR
jgi:hypothetical protein